jgi:DNA-binding HxlR family transcriptional regulator
MVHDRRTAAGRAAREALSSPRIRMHYGIANPEAELERAGSRALSAFANPLHARVLRAHADGPQRLASMHKDLGWAASASVRSAVMNLRDLGALVKLETRRMPYKVENELTPAGGELLLVADIFEAWLARAPEGPIVPDSHAAKSAVKALIAGWNSTLVRALAAQPRSLTELDSLIPHINYPRLERRIAKMRVTRQVEPLPARGKSKPFAASERLRRSEAPLCAASRCELRHMNGRTAPITYVEIEAAFLLSLPLAPLPAGAEGTCLLATQTENGSATGGELAGVTVEVERGTVSACVARVSSEPATWMVGGPATWLEVLIDGRYEDLRLGGASPQLAADLVNGLHFAVSQGR